MTRHARRRVKKKVRLRKKQPYWYQVIKTIMILVFLLVSLGALAIGITWWNKDTESPLGAQTEILEPYLSPIREGIDAVIAPKDCEGTDKNIVFESNVLVIPARETLQSNNLIFIEDEVFTWLLSLNQQDFTEKRWEIINLLAAQHTPVKGFNYVAEYAVSFDRAYAGNRCIQVPNVVAYANDVMEIALEPLPVVEEITNTGYEPEFPNKPNDVEINLGISIGAEPLPSPTAEIAPLPTPKPQEAYIGVEVLFIDQFTDALGSLDIACNNKYSDIVQARGCYNFAAREMTVKVNNVDQSSLEAALPQMLAESLNSISAGTYACTKNHGEVPWEHVVSGTTKLWENANVIFAVGLPGDLSLVNTNNECALVKNSRHEYQGTYWSVTLKDPFIPTHMGSLTGGVITNQIPSEVYMQEQNVFLYPIDQ